MSLHTAIIYGSVREARVGIRVVRYLTAAQEHALLAALPARYHPLILTALNTGMRRGELLRLKWSDIDWFERRRR